jgi:hypothetical protein
MLERWPPEAWPESVARPIPKAYWVRPGRLLAGEYAGARLPALARRKLRLLLEAGVTSFIDLTQAGEAGLPPYEPLLAQEAQRRGQQVDYLRSPIPDFSLPTPEGLRATLDHLDAALLAGRRVYLHCWGGIGRTGTVVGCHLVRHGLTGPEALGLIARLRRPLPNGGRASPETAAQRNLVLSWAELDGRADG